MRIYFNGDSHTIGSELVNPKENAYAYVLTKKLNAVMVDNPSVGGAGNDRILRLTNNYLDDCEAGKDKLPDLVIIGWSEVCRFDWFHDNAYRTYGSYEDGLSTESAKNTYSTRAKFHEKFLTNDLSSIGIARYQHNQMYNLHCRLDYLKVPHLFFNAVESFYELFDRPVYKTMLNPMTYENEFNKNRLVELSWNNAFWKPYDLDGSFLAWGRNNNYSITELKHLEAKAHHHFSDVLIHYMRERNIIKR
jgi:hypothetical protein